LKELEN
jgi:hypothetical protein